MRKLFLMCAVALLASCERMNVVGEDDAQVTNGRKFTFHVKGDFERNYEEMNARAVVRLEENNTAGITDIWVLDYVDGSLVQQAHQTAGQQGVTFGKVDMTLAYGHHDVKFIASKGDGPALSAGSLAWQKVKDTFTQDYPVDVTASSNGNRAPELKRAIGGVRVSAADAVPEGTQKVTVTMKRSLSLALPSLVAADPASDTNEFNISEVQWNRTGLALTTYTLVDDEMTTDVLVTVTGAGDAIISQFTVPNVTIKKNRITTLSGEVFGRGSWFFVSIDETWDEGVEVSF